jgi:hypothetical protein
MGLGMNSPEIILKAKNKEPAILITRDEQNSLQTLK